MHYPFDRLTLQRLASNDRYAIKQFVQNRSLTVRLVRWHFRKMGLPADSDLELEIVVEACIEFIGELAVAIPSKPQQLWLKILLRRIKASISLTFAP